MPRLIWVFAGRTVILLVLSWGGSDSIISIVAILMISRSVAEQSWKQGFSERSSFGSPLQTNACYSTVIDICPGILQCVLQCVVYFYVFLAYFFLLIYRSVSMFFFVLFFSIIVVLSNKNILKLSRKSINTKMLALQSFKHPKLHAGFWT